MYKNNLKYITVSQPESEQAASFSPFTRGYYATPQNMVFKNQFEYDFEIIDFSENELINLFQQDFNALNEKSENSKEDFSLIHLKISGLNFETFIYKTAVLRTLLTFYCVKKYNNAEKFKFKF